MIRFIAEPIFQKLHPACHGHIMADTNVLLCIHGTQDMHLVVSKRYSHSFKVHTRALKDTVVRRDGYFSNPWGPWDETYYFSWMIVINNADNQPGFLCNSLWNVVILMIVALMYNMTLTFLCEFLLGCGKIRPQNIGWKCCCRQNAVWCSFYLCILVDNGSWAIKWMLRQRWCSCCSFQAVVSSLLMTWVGGRIKVTNMASWVKANERLQWLNMLLDECSYPFSSSFICMFEKIRRAPEGKEKWFRNLVLIMSLTTWSHPAVKPSLDLIFDCFKFLLFLCPRNRFDTWTTA